MMLAVGERYRSLLEKSMIYQGVDPLWISDNPRFDPRLAAHADLNLAALENKIIVSKGLDDKIVNFLTKRGYQVHYARGDESAQYPHDTGLCVCDTGEFLIANPKTADMVVWELFSRRKLISVKQGCVRCCVCVADSRSIITSDSGIARNARDAGLDVLQIRSGFIELPGFNEGFIGGASIRLAQNKMAFVGSLHTHPDGASILSFLRQRALEVVFLKEGALLDIGSGITLS